MKRIFVWLQLGMLLLAAQAAHAATFFKLDENVIEERLHKVAGANPAREATLKTLFAEVGCKDLSEEHVPRRLPNVVCVLPGESDKTIIVGAHFDKVDAGEGVVDNWSGASLLPSLYQSLANNPRRHTFIFVGFSAEEIGLIGSKHYVLHMTPEERAKTDAMVNMDSLGLTPTKIWVSHSDPALVSDLAAVAQQSKLPVEGVDVDEVGSSDSESFARRNIPHITIHSVTQDTLPILHSARDNFDAIQPKDYYDSYRLIAAYLAYLDMKLGNKLQQGTTSSH
jgi:Zn-dependent M28 family amino/carboxypeptidase